MEEPIFITTDNKRGQRSILALSVFGSLIFLLFLLFDYSTPMLFLFAICIFLSYAVNHFFSKFYDVKIENEIIIIENIWRTTQQPLTNLTDIQIFNFISPYPFNPFLKFVFKNQQAIATKFQHANKVYLQKGNIELFLSDLKKELLIK